LNNFIDEDPEEAVDQEFPVIENEGSLNNRSFSILEKNFTFGNEDSPTNLQKKNTFDDLSSSSLFDMEIEFSDKKQVNMVKEEELEDKENENKDSSLEFISALDQLIEQLETENTNGIQTKQEEGMDERIKTEDEVKNRRPGLGVEEIEIQLDREKKAPFKIFKMPYDLSRVQEERYWNRRRGGERNSDDNFDRYMDQKLKKKMKLERGEGDDDGKSPFSEFEYKTSSKKGSMHERYEGLSYNEEFPRRSQREKREPPKTFENKIFGTDFGFTFVEFKQHKTEKIKISINFR